MAVAASSAEDAKALMLPEACRSSVWRLGFKPRLFSRSLAVSTGRPLIALAMLSKLLLPDFPRLLMISSWEEKERIAFASVLVFLIKSNDSVK